MKQSISFGASKRLARFEFGSKIYFSAIGFENISPPDYLSEIDIDNGMMTAFVYELLPKPHSATSLARDIVEVSDKEADPGYLGHQGEGISKIFPSIRAFTAKDIGDEETWKIFFLLCISECEVGDSWIDKSFSENIRGICELSLLNVPYETLCRSIFDVDPAAMFLALYRCMEALYAYSSARKVIGALDLSQDWADVAAVLEDSLGWHPKEDAALISLMSHVANYDAEKIFESLGEKLPSSTTNTIQTLAGNRIYSLRNGLVHYRPAHRKMDHSKVNWNRLCEAMSSMVCHIYSEVFPV